MPPYSFLCSNGKRHVVLLTKERKIKRLEEQGSWLALAPVLTAGVFYFLPLGLQQQRLIQFLPQLVAYIALGIWCICNSHRTEKLGLKLDGFLNGFRWGVVTGLLLGGFNAFVILWAVPGFGGDILFLKEIPHAKVATWAMVPWIILLIAIGVELNFRGFLLGRLERLFAQWFYKISHFSLIKGSSFAVVSSALVFAFDPFLVSTFQHLHWIAVWDGLVWGWIYVRKSNLYMVIVAHAVEVVIVYLSVKFFFM